MSLLNAEPGGLVRSMEEFFAVAHAIESDAAGRYAATAVLLRREGFGKLADLFEHLADLEQQHVGQIETWASRQEVAAIAATPWPLPATFDESPHEAAGSKLATPYRALAAAVRHEQRAFAFWSYVAAHADREDVRLAAEQMAREELEHAALLRRERRTAYRTERPELTATSTLSSLAALERQLGRLMELATDARGRPFAAALPVQADKAAEQLDQLSRAHAVELKLGVPPGAEPENLEAISEFLAEAYLLLAESTQDERLMQEAQKLAAMAIERLGLIDTNNSPERF